MNIYMAQFYAGATIVAENKFNPRSWVDIIKKENIVERKIHDTYFLIDISDKYLDDKCHLYEINEIGDFIWKQLGMSDTVSDIANINVYKV